MDHERNKDDESSDASEEEDDHESSDASEEEDDRESSDASEEEDDRESRDDGDGQEGVEADEGDGETPSVDPDEKPGRPRIFKVTLITLCVMALLAYAVNVYLNITVESEVREHCWAENQRLAHAINEATEDRLPALDWMVSLYRARRRYAREICDETVLQLAWWRWNFGRPIEADISTHTQEEISRTLSRASLSCEHEIQTMNDLMQRELEVRGSEAEVLARADEMVAGQLESCRELRSAIAESRPGFWPPLVANGQLEVPDRLRSMMPRALHVLAQEEEEQSP